MSSPQEGCSSHGLRSSTDLRIPENPSFPGVFKGFQGAGEGSSLSWEASSALGPSFTLLVNHLSGKPPETSQVTDAGQSLPGVPSVHGDAFQT